MKVLDFTRKRAEKQAKEKRSLLIDCGRGVISGYPPAVKTSLQRIDDLLAEINRLCRG